MQPSTLIVLALVVIGLLPAFVARSKGYSFLLWWLFGTVVWILATPMAFGMRPNAKTARQCQFCRASVPVAATVCASCSREIGSGTG